MNQLTLVLALALASTLATTVVGCSSSTTDTGTTQDSGTPATGNNITVKSNQFVPATLTVKVGDTVTWTWAGGSHTVTSGANCTSDSAYGTTGIQSAVGATFTHTYAKAGTFEYFCEPHCVSAGMKGTIVVQ